MLLFRPEFLSVSHSAVSCAELLAPILYCMSSGHKSLISLFQNRSMEEFYFVLFVCLSFGCWKLLFYIILESGKLSSQHYCSERWKYIYLGWHGKQDFYCSPVYESLQFTWFLKHLFSRKEWTGRTTGFICSGSSCVFMSPWWTDKI